MVDLDESTLTLDEIKSTLFALWRTFTQGQAPSSIAGIPWELKYNDSINNITDGYDKIVFYSGISAPLALRFQMSLNDSLKAEQQTRYTHDKLQPLDVLASSDTHLSQFTMPLNFSIKIVLSQKGMTTTQAAVKEAPDYLATSGGVLDWDNYGGPLDSRGKTVYAILDEIVAQTRLGSESSATIFTYVSGRDGRLDIDLLILLGISLPVIIYAYLTSQAPYCCRFKCPCILQ